MKYGVIVRPEAENDLKEAFSWYEDKRVGLGHNFLLQVNAGLNFIMRNPEIHRLRRSVSARKKGYLLSFQIRRKIFPVLLKMIGCLRNM